MNLSTRPRLTEVIGWAPIAVTMAILLFVLYRITFVPNATPANAQPSSIVSTATPAKAKATVGLQMAGVVEPVTKSPGLTPDATQAPDGVSLQSNAVAATEPATAVPTSASARSTSPPTNASSTPDATRSPSLSAVRSAVVAPAPRPEPSPTAIVEWSGSYVIKSGDTMSTIATHYGVSLQELQKRNKIAEANRIEVGQKLIVPARP